ncbi:uncharacterized protein LOC101482043 [Maylandia zebra]|uniref:uncharacterized protein LOC101482043 n=1 Tax=Maylandia zebra TaxID=106582 RepID=UPI00403D5493
MVVVQEDASHQDEEKSLLGEKPEWKCEQDATRAAWLYKSELLSKYETRKAVVLQMDLRESIVDQQRSLISLYKTPKVEWAGPVSCKLEGDVAVGEGVKRFFFSKAVSLVQSGLHLNFDLTRLFDGEPEHLTPSTSQTLLESDMFLVAGRIMGHSFIHGGPCVSGHNTNKPSSQAAEERASGDHGMAASDRKIRHHSSFLTKGLRDCSLLREKINQGELFYAVYSRKDSVACHRR